MQALLASAWSEHMDWLSVQFAIFLIATFAGAFIAGVSGFAFGLIVSSLWLYVLSPLQTTALIVGFGLLVQAYSVWKLRGALDWRKLLPFVIGAAPVGVLNEDLRIACLAAVTISPQACLEFAAGHTWEASARAFVDTIANVRAIDPESDAAEFAAEQPGFVA